MGSTKTHVLIADELRIIQSIIVMYDIHDDYFIKLISNISSLVLNSVEILLKIHASDYVVHCRLTRHHTKNPLYYDIF